MSRIAAALTATTLIAGLMVAEVADAGGGGSAASPRACSLTDIDATVVACSGWYEGNLDSTPNVPADITYLNELGADLPTTMTSVGLVDLSSLHSTTIDFGQTLYGDTWISFHAGAAKGAPGDVIVESTGFFEILAGMGLNSFTVNFPGVSNAVLWETGAKGPAPEPATWTMMMAGIGLAGAMFRSRRRTVTA